MEYIDLRNCVLESTNVLCPACQTTLLQKINNDGVINPPDFKYYLVCPNEDCKFLGSPDVCQVDTIYKRLIAYGIKYLDFSAVPIMGYDPVAVTFDAYSLGLVFDEYIWTFGDGSTLTTKMSQVTHTYFLPGTYTVDLKVFDTEKHQYYSCSKTNLIIVNPYVAPVANFVLDKNFGNNKLTVHFTDTSVGSDIRKWYWDFGDGVTSTEQNPTHLFAYPGTYTVSLKIINSKNVESILTKPNVVNVNLTAPIASFAQDTIAGYAPLTVTFTYTGVDDYIVDNFLWSFGDGTTSTEQNPTHTYNIGGIYNVQLQVSNSVGSDVILKPNAVYVETPRLAT